MAESPAEYVLSLEGRLRDARAACKDAAATAELAIGRLQEAEKIVQYLRSSAVRRELHWNDVEVLLSQYDSFVQSLGHA